MSKVDAVLQKKVLKKLYSSEILTKEKHVSILITDC